ncbi:uncharacterized protein MELLADRAFT_57758, partial [Melampsora larici-populina 98AG31]
MSTGFSRSRSGNLGVLNPHQTITTFLNVDHLDPWSLPSHHYRLRRDAREKVDCQTAI